MDEGAGRLSERIRFEGRDETRGAAGERVGSWQVRFERWARIELVERADHLPVSADTRHPARRWRLTMRDGLRPDLDMRASWRGGLLALTAISEDPAHRGWLLI